MKENTLSDLVVSPVLAAGVVVGLMSARAVAQEGGDSILPVPDYDINDDPLLTTDTSERRLDPDPPGVSPTVDPSTSDRSCDDSAPCVPPPCPPCDPVIYPDPDCELPCYGDPCDPSGGDGDPEDPPEGDSSDCDGTIGISA